MESAIPSHLKCPRTLPTRTPDNFSPPIPATVARFPIEAQQVVMAYIGFQYAPGTRETLVLQAEQWLISAVHSLNGPNHQERSRYEDEAGFINHIWIAYWDKPAEFESWFKLKGDAWTKDVLGESSTGNAGSIGTFIEVLTPTMDRFESLFSSDQLEGVGYLADGLSGPTLEHFYWGAVRDRIAASQTNPLAPGAQSKIIRNGLHAQVMPQENLCLIRSGQDWTMADADERRLYNEDVEPILKAGMVFLRDEGQSIGCHANRYMTLVDNNGETIEKTFGMSWWRSLADLELWAESHPTHVAIFGAALTYLQRLGPSAKLKLYHEVTVVTAAQQHFEYFNCHPKTGMLRAAL